MSRRGSMHHIALAALPWGSSDHARVSQRQQARRRTDWRYLALWSCIASIAFVTYARAEAPKPATRPGTTGTAHAISAALIAAHEDGAPGTHSASTGTAGGAATLPSAGVVPAGPYENLPIARAGSRSESGPTTAAAASPEQSPFQLGRLCMALGIVLLAIYILQKFGRRFFGGGRSLGAHRAFNVIARSPISPRQQLVLIHVGRRLVLASNNGSQMASLCEIDDADEVASILGQVRGEAPALKQKASRDGEEAFQSILRGAGREYRRGGEVVENIEDEFRPPQDFAATSEMDDSPAKPEFEIENVSGGGALADTGKELVGLMNKVRRLSQHFQRS